MGEGEGEGEGEREGRGGGIKRQPITIFFNSKTFNFFLMFEFSFMSVSDIFSCPLHEKFQFKTNQQVVFCI